MPADCSAAVRVSYYGTGALEFEIDVSDCKFSEGRFEYNSEITRADGSVVVLNKRVNWPGSAGDSKIKIKESISIASDEQLTNVDILPDTIECICIEE